MAALTWKNVDAPSFNGANDALRLALLGQQNAFDNIGKALDGFQESKTTGVSGELLTRLNSYNDPAALEAARADGSLYKGLDPRYIDRNAQEAVGSRVNALLGNVQARATIAGTEATTRGTEASTGLTQAQTAGVGISNEQRQFNLNEDRATAAAAPEAAKVFAQIRDKYLSGSPTSADEASALTLQNSALLKRAGYDIDSVMQGNFSAANAGTKRAMENVANADFWTKTADTKSGKALADTALQDFAQNPEGAMNAIRNHPTLNADAKIEAMKSYQDRVGAFTEPKDDISELLGVPSPFINNGQGPALTYSNQNATRNQPLNPNLAKPLETIAAGLGLKVNVISGGQPSNGPNRVGSHRHDNGNAGDVDIYLGDRKLSPNNPEDLPYFRAMYTRMRDAGIGGIGEGDNYMGDGRLHVGFGSEGIWGEGGRSKNAPAWLKQIRQEYETNNPNARSFDGTLTGNDVGEAPVGYNITEDSLNNPTSDPEELYTFKLGDSFVNIPTIIGGQKVSNAEAIDAFAAGTNEAVGRFKDEKSAKSAALKRVDDIRKQQDEILKGGPVNDQVAANAANNQLAQNNLNKPSANSSGNLYPGLVGQPSDAGSVKSPTTIGSNSDLNIPIAGMTLDAENAMDSVFNGDDDLKQAIVNRKNLGASKGDIISGLLSGSLKSYKESALTTAYNEIKDKYPGLSPDIIGVLMERNGEYRQQSLPRGKWPFNDIPLGLTPRDQFGGTEDGGNGAFRIDTNKVDADIKKLAEQDPKTGQWKLNKGIALLNSDNLKKSYKVKLDSVQKANALNESRHQAFLNSQANVPTNPNRERAVQIEEDRYQTHKQEIIKQMEALNASGIGTANTNKLEQK